MEIMHNILKCKYITTIVMIILLFQDMLTPKSNNLCIFLKSWKIKIPNFIHIHFPDYNYLKAGISASLGIFFSIYSSILEITVTKSYLFTGEIDILGNISEVGGMEYKYKLFKKEKFDFFIVPTNVKKQIGKKNTEDSAIIGFNTLYDMCKFIKNQEGLNEIK